MSTKSFKHIENPVEQFLTKPEDLEALEKLENTTPASPAVQVSPINKRPKPPEGYKLNPEYIETKSKRLQLLVKPSLHRAMQKKAAAMGVSVNELVNLVLEAYTEER